MKKNAILITSFKPGSPAFRIGSTPFFIKVADYSLQREEDEIISMIRSHYISNINEMRSKVNLTFVEIYGERLPFKERITSEILIKLKQIMEQTGKSIGEITAEIRRYLGYNCSFFRIEGARKLPVDSQRITKAYELIKQKKSILQVEDALYF